MQEFIQLRISLNKSNPLIWRLILLHRDSTFFELHHIIQITMGWQNYHMYEFNLEGYRIGQIFEDEKSHGYGSDSVLDAKTIKLKDVVTPKGDVIKYEYDFGDGWEHSIVVEENNNAEQQCYPVCIDGQMACPPEDCGGIHGFYGYLDILNDKKHPEHKEMVRWFPKNYNSANFDKERVNTQLTKLDKYIDKWLKG